jgi:hypothetical protein
MKSSCINFCNIQFYRSDPNDVILFSIYIKADTYVRVVNTNEFCKYRLVGVAIRTHYDRLASVWDMFRY